MLQKTILKIVILLLLANASLAANKSAVTVPIPIQEIRGFAAYPPKVKIMIQAAYQLTTKNLTYIYASANPKNGGMDCSGTIYYLLHQMKIDSPRQSDEIYNWAKTNGNLKQGDKNFTALKPGDLLFWSGTYNIHRDVTHVMIYLGKDQQNRPLMFGASDGRPYRGRKMWGVSVFDFLLPNGKTKAKFLGYGCIPGLSCDSRTQTKS
jgi:hypothetical protein